MGTILGAIAQGILWGIMTLGVYITYKVMQFSDLTVDGSFATGGAVAAVLITVGVNPLLALIISLIAGMACGFITGVLHTALKIPPILSGILTMIALYSINLRIQGKANISLLGKDTVFTFLQEKFNLSSNMSNIIVGLIFAVIIIGGLYWFFGTEIGSAIRATGNNEDMVKALGVNISTIKILGLMISNSLVALAGGLVAQSQGFAAVDMGTGSIVIGLASVIIGEVIFGSRFSFAYKMTTVVLGSIIYRLIIALVLQMGMRSTDLKLFTAIIVALALSLPVFKEKINTIKYSRKRLN